MDEDQDPIIANIEGLGQLHFPAGTDPTVVDAAVKQAIKEQKIAHFMKGQTPPPSSLGDVAERGPLIGGAIGGAVGSVPGAIVGGATGALVRDLARANRSDPRTPKTPLSAAGSVGNQGFIQGALTAGGDVIGRDLIPMLGSLVTNRAVPFVRSALKSPLSDVRARARVEGLNPNEVADQQAQFIVDRQLRTAAQAEALAKQSGKAVDDVTAAAETENPNLRVDTAERIPRYFNQFTRERIEPQMLPGRDRAAVQAVGREVVEDSPLSRPTYREPPPETLEEGLIRGMREGVTAAENAGKRATAPTTGHQFATEGGAFPQSSRPRELRTDLRPSELLPIIRTKSFFDPNAPAGQIQGGKVLERAVRDSFKEAVPEAAPHLQTQGRAMDAERLLDRTEWRDANRDTAGLGAIMGFANKAPGIGMLLQWLKEGQLAAGLAAGKFGPQIARSGPAVGAGSEDLARLVQLLLSGSQQQPPREP